MFLLYIFMRLWEKWFFYWTIEEKNNWKRRKIFTKRRRKNYPQKRINIINSSLFAKRIRCCFIKKIFVGEDRWINYIKTVITNKKTEKIRIHHFTCQNKAEEDVWINSHIFRFKNYIFCTMFIKTIFNGIYFLCYFMNLFLINILTAFLVQSPFKNAGTNMVIYWTLL